MKILHLCLGCFYIDGYNYQENVLPRINKEDGHEVRILASTETFIDNMNLGYVEPREYMTEYGVPIKRIPYIKVGNDFITHKVRKYSHVYEEIATFEPDVIMIHSMAFWSVRDVIRYKKDHPEVKLYADTHTDEKNSARSVFSKYILHKGLYRYLYQFAIPYVEKLLYVTSERKKFAMNYYGIDEAKLEFYPLGGIIFSEKKYRNIREIYRKKIGVTDKDIVFIHSGKIDILKRTEELIRAFSKVSNPNARLILIGVLNQEREETIIPMIKKDNRISFLGWQPSEELMNYLCASDVYMQPGSQSATLENALCCRCTAVVYPHEAYTSEYSESGILWCKTEEDMRAVFEAFACKAYPVEDLKKKAVLFAKTKLDYQVLASRLYQ